MWIRAVIGVVLIALGGVWIAQGTGTLHGSVMTGHSQYTGLGIVVVIVGVAMLGWAWILRGRRPR